MKKNSNDKPVKKYRSRRAISKRRRLIQKFVAIVFCIVCLFLIVASAATISYISNLSQESTVYELDDEGNKVVVPKKKPNFIENIIKPQHTKTNFVLLGLDDDKTRTDVIIVGTFDSETKNISLLSIPRDTKITMSNERVNVLRSEGRYVPAGGIMKINEVHSYAGSKHNTEYICSEIEDLLNIKLDYYVKIDLEAFVYIVDTLGGVDIEIPSPGLYYSDPIQNLYINLPAGMQHLDGKKAEEFVRFRGYPDADISRIKAQQTFMKELFKQMLNKKNIMNNIVSYVNGFFKYVDTNFGIADVPKYVGYINEIDPSNMQMYSLPGEAEYFDVSYFLHDVEKTHDLVKEIFIDGVNVKELEQIELQDSKDKKIEVSNGGNIDGLANRKKNELTSDGYNVVKVSTFNGTKEDKTRIIVAKSGVGEDLHSLFEDSVIVVAPEQISSDIDIKIILGLSEQ